LPQHQHLGDLTPDRSAPRNGGIICTGEQGWRHSELHAPAEDASPGSTSHHPNQLLPLQPPTTFWLDDGNAVQVPARVRHTNFPVSVIAADLCASARVITSCLEQAQMRPSWVANLTISVVIVILVSGKYQDYPHYQRLATACIAWVLSHEFIDANICCTFCLSDARGGG